MSHRQWSSVACHSIGALVLMVSEIAAQRPTTGQQTGPAITGIVADTGGNAVPDAELLIRSLRQLVRSGPDGSFRFESVKPGKYEVAARRLGYFPQVRSVTVTDSGAKVSFSLVPGTPSLPPVVTAVARGGLTGVVGDTAYHIVSGAEVSVVSGGHRTTTDSTGSFFLALLPGPYVLRVSGPGFASRLVSVTIPKDSGRRVVVWLTPASRGETARQAAALDGLRLRLDTAHVVWSRLFTHEDILRLNMTDAVQLGTIAAGKPLSETCNVFVDGGPETAPLWSIDPAEIEAMEAYVQPGSSTAVTSIKHNEPISLQKTTGSSCGAIVYVWLRR